jgi:hypothetical protein
MRTVLMTGLIAAALLMLACPALAEAPSPLTVPAPDMLTDVQLTQCVSCCPPRCMPAETPCGTCCWKWRAGIAIWVAGMEGDATVRGNKSAVSASPADSLEAILDFGDRSWTGNVVGNYGRWGFRAAGMTLRLGDEVDATTAGRSVSAGLGLDLGQLDVSYCVKRCPAGTTCGCPASLAYEVFAGLRYFFLETELGVVGGGPGVRGSQDFVDPIVGGRITWDLGNRWSFDVEADIGGFGVGSDFTWQARAGARYRIARWFSAEAGMKVLDIDYSNGSGASLFEWDVLMWGPYLALNFHF